MNTKQKAKKSPSRSSHATHKIRASGRWAAATRKTHRTATHLAAPPAENPGESHDSEPV